MAPNDNNPQRSAVGRHTIANRYTQPGANGLNRANRVGFNYDAGFDKVLKQQRSSTGENKAEKPLDVWEPD